MPVQFFITHTLRVTGGLPLSKTLAIFYIRPFARLQDKQRQKKNWNSRLIPKEIETETLRNYFYRMTTEVLQSQCEIFKRFGFTLFIYCKDYVQDYVHPSKI